MSATGTAALAQKLTSKKSNGKKNGNGKKAAKKTPAKKTAGRRSEVPWQKVADLYNQGLSVAEISDKLNLTRLKTKKGKENPYPYFLTVGYLTKLANGVEVDGKEISIVRGSKNKKRAAARSKE